MPLGQGILACSAACWPHTRRLSVTHRSRDLDHSYARHAMHPRRSGEDAQCYHDANATIQVYYKTTVTPNLQQQVLKKSRQTPGLSLSCVARCAKPGRSGGSQPHGKEIPFRVASPPSGSLLCLSTPLSRLTKTWKTRGRPLRGPSADGGPAQGGLRFATKKQSRCHCEPCRGEAISTCR